VDAKGNPWLKTWKLSQRMVQWMAYYGSRTGVLCLLTQPLKTSTPETATLTFELEGIVEGVDISYSSWMNIEGFRQDGKPYKMEMQLMQKQSVPKSHGD
jgi:hypothetical protein